MLSRDLIDSLFPPDLPEPEHWEQRYPPRDLPGDAKVTRFAPSPTGFLTIGGVFTATIDADVARQSDGVYLVRLEDTDQARVTEGAEAQFAEAFSYFSIDPDEDDRAGRYGPYSQSARSQTYLTYVRELLRQGRAYPCFATKQDLEEITADDNRNDMVILKSSDQELPLPTYHFAHAVDDHLMRVTLVIRSDEWLSSVPLHHQLFDALGFPRVRYAHLAPLMSSSLAMSTSGPAVPHSASRIGAASARSSGISASRPLARPRR